MDFCLKSSNLNVETLPGTSVSLCGTGDLRLKLLSGTFDVLCEPFLVSGAFIWNLHVDPIFHVCGSFKCGTVECDWMRSRNLYLKPLCELACGTHCLKVLCGTFVWKPGEPKCGTLWNLEPFKCGIFIGDLGKPEPIVQNLWTFWAWKHSVEPFCGGILETLCGTLQDLVRGFRPPQQTTPRLHWKNPKLSKLLGETKKHRLKSLGKKQKNRKPLKSPKSSHSPSKRYIQGTRSNSWSSAIWPWRKKRSTPGPDCMPSVNG